MRPWQWSCWPTSWRTGAIPPVWSWPFPPTCGPLWLIPAPRCCCQTCGWDGWTCARTPGTRFMFHLDFIFGIGTRSWRLWAPEPLIFLCVCTVQFESTQSMNQSINQLSVNIFTKIISQLKIIILPNLGASTHMRMCLSLGDSEYTGASYHPAAGVQIQGWDGSHPSESGWPPDYPGRQWTQLPDCSWRHPNG